MKGFWKALGLVALWVLGLACCFVLLVALGWGGLIVIVGVGIVYCWIIFAYLYYRLCRREELLHVIASSAEDGIPLAPAIRAYVQDRPLGPMRGFWLACLLCVLPVPGFYWIWYRQNSFDRRVEELVRLLEQGVALYQALQMIPALATKETILAAAIGESTGQLPRCLRGATQHRVSALWIDFMPQIVYPFVVLFVISTILSFVGYAIMPKFRKIFQDFGVDLPTATQALLSQMDMLVEYWYVVVLAVQAVLLGAVMLIFSSTVRWFFPGVGAVYRRSVRGRVLRVLGLLLETGKPLPDSLAVLAQLPLGHMALTRIDQARRLINEGSPFAESLLAVGLLPVRMLPLVHAAERAGNLPWALTEMADSLYKHTMRMIQAIMQVAFPTVVVVLGLVVAVVVFSLFMPIVKLITELSL